MDERIIEQRMTTALKLAEKCWKEAGMPRIYDGEKETGKVSIAILATKIFDHVQVRSS